MVSVIELNSTLLDHKEKKTYILTFWNIQKNCCLYNTKKFLVRRYINTLIFMTKTKLHSMHYLIKFTMLFSSGKTISNPKWRFGTCSTYTSPSSLLLHKIIFTKLLAFSERLTKIKVRIPWTLFVILLTYAVICKKGFWNGNETVQYPQKCKCCNVDQNHMRNFL